MQIGGLQNPDLCLASPPTEAFQLTTFARIRCVFSLESVFPLLLNTAVIH